MMHEMRCAGVLLQECFTRTATLPRIFQGHCGTAAVIPAQDCEFSRAGARTYLQQRNSYQEES